MGLDLIYRCQGRETTSRFPMADWDTLSRLREPLPGEVAAMADVPGFGEEEVVPLDELKDAIGRLDGYLRDHADLLPHTYEFRCEYILAGPERYEGGGFSTGGMSGLQLPEDGDHRYAIRAGLDECRLDRMALLPDGTGRVVETRDLRGEEGFETVNCGRVRIRKRRAKSSLRAGLAKIREFLDSLPAGSTVTKILC